MKNLVSFTSVLLLVLTAGFSAMAASTPAMIIRITPGEASKSIDVQLANLQRQRTQIAIQDVNGKLWYSEFCEKENGYAKRLNLDGIPEGQYICFVQNRRGRSTQAFRMQTNALSFFEAPAKSNVDDTHRVYTGVAHPSIVRIKAENANTIQLQLANLQHQNVLIRLNALGEGTAFEQKLQGHAGYAQKIDLTGMLPGAYFLYLKAGDAVLIQHLNLSAEGIQFGKLEKFDQSGQTPPALVKTDNPG